MGLHGFYEQQQIKNMSNMIKMHGPEIWADRLKYGSNCYGMIKVNVRDDATGFSYVYTRCGGEWFVGQNGGKSVSGKASDILGGLELCEMDIQADSIISLTEAQ